MVLLALLVAASPLDEARKAYDDLDYEGCVSRVAALKRVGGAERASADLLRGLCEFALGQEGLARAHLEAAFRRRPLVTLPPHLSPKESAFIDEVKARVAQHQPTRPAQVHQTEPTPTAAISEPPQPALVTPQPTDTPRAQPSEVTSPDTPLATSLTPTPRPPPSISAAIVTPNRPTWVPFVTGGLALAAAGAGAGFGLSSQSLVAKATAEPVQVTAGGLRARAQNEATVANVAFAVASTAAIATLVTWVLTH